MGYVWTPEQIESYESYYREVVYHFSGVSVGFTTTAEFVRQVLPPCLDPPAEPRGMVAMSLGRESWNGVPTVAEEENTAGVWLSAVRDGVEGLYSLTVVVNGDMNVATGRESWGMPKKRGESVILNDGEQLYAYSERRGTRLIEVAATLGAQLEPFEEESRMYELKGWLAPDGDGLQDDPVLVVFDTHTSYRWAREAEAVLRLTGTIEDPVADIPIVATDQGLFYAGTERFRLKEQIALPDRAVYRPYIYGRLYDNWTERIKATPDAVRPPRSERVAPST